MISETSRKAREFETPSRPQKERHRGGPSNNQTLSKMEKYIKREDLGEALGAIAKIAMENADALWTEITIRNNWRGEGVAMTVKVLDAYNYKRLEEVDYFIVADSSVDAQAMFAEALDKKAHHDKWLAEQEAQAAAAKEQNVESNNEEE